MKLLSALAFLISRAVAQAGGSYTDAEAKDHAGETAEVHGKVFDVHVSSSGLTLINFGAKYPAQTFTAVIFKEHAGDFPEVEKYNGVTLSVTGPLKLHREKLEMVLDAPAQLKVLVAGVTEPPATAESSPAAAPGEAASTVTGPDGVSRRILPFTRRVVEK